MSILPWLTLRQASSLFPQVADLIIWCNIKVGSWHWLLHDVLAGNSNARLLPPSLLYCILLLLLKVKVKF